MHNIIYKLFCILICLNTICFSIKVDFCNKCVMQKCCLPMHYNLLSEVWKIKRRESSLGIGRRETDIPSAVAIVVVGHGSNRGSMSINKSTRAPHMSPSAHHLELPAFCLASVCCANADALFTRQTFSTPLSPSTLKHRSFLPIKQHCQWQEECPGRNGLFPSVQIRKVYHYVKPYG
jgi:hypothetical protein